MSSGYNQNWRNETSYQESYNDDDDHVKEVTTFFLFFAILLVIGIILSKVLLETKRLHTFYSEAALSLTIGVVGSFLYWQFLNDSYHHQQLQQQASLSSYLYNLSDSWLSFRPNVFFMGLLPPILFNSGYQLRRELFYRHIKPILLFACLGTTISAFATSFLLYGIVQTGWIRSSFTPTLLELLTFGALLSATDTVSVLTVFQSKKVDPHLYYLVFGESALNDAVSLVLFNIFSNQLRSTTQQQESLSIEYYFAYIIDFFMEAIVSPIVGFIMSFGFALLCKNMNFRHHPHLELPLYLLLMYIPFVTAECLNLSGIVTIFVSGICARRYVAPNISSETAKNADVIFRTASYMAEISIFLELGLSVFGLPFSSFHWPFIIMAFLASLIGRAIGVYPLSYLYNRSLQMRHKVNLAATEHTNNLDDFQSQPNNNNEVIICRSESVGSLPSASRSSNPREEMKAKPIIPASKNDKVIPTNFMHMIWFTGLRGAVAYACARRFPNLYQHGDEFIATTMIIVLVSIIFMGGAIEPLLHFLHIDMNIDEDHYMKEWHKTRSLKGAFHYFENEYIYHIAVGNDGISTSCNNDTHHHHHTPNEMNATNEMKSNNYENKADVAFDYFLSNNNSSSPPVLSYKRSLQHLTFATANNDHHDSGV